MSMIGVVAGAAAGTLIGIAGGVTRAAAPGQSIGWVKTTRSVSMILNLMTAACGVLMIMAQGLSLSSLLYAVGGIILFLVGKGIWKRVIIIAGANRPAA